MPYSAASAGDIARLSTYSAVALSSVAQNKTPIEGFACGFFTFFVSLATTHDRQVVAPC